MSMTSPNVAAACRDERSCHPVSRAELQRRRGLLEACMREHGLDALVLQGANGISGGGSFRWATGQASGNYNPRTVIVPVGAPMVLIDQGPFGFKAELDADSGPMPGVGRRLGTPSYPSVGYTNRYDVTLVLDELRRLGARRVGVAGSGAMTHAFLGALEAAFGADLADVSDDIDLMKARKSEEEMQAIRATAAMQDHVLTQLLGHIRPGMHDFEVMAKAQYLGQLHGSELGMFFGSSAPLGEPALLRPRTQQGRMLAEGDVFTLLIENNGPGGYFTHLARPIVLGHASAELQDAFCAALEAQRFTLQRLRPGASAPELFAQYNAHLRARGWPEEARLHCHGQGYDLVERPLVRHDETMAIDAGMNIAVHPALSTNRLFVTVCENYLVGQDGPECVHATPQRIFER